MVRDLVARRKVTFYHMPTGQMTADGFIKPLPAAALTAIRSRVGVRTQDHAI